MALKIATKTMARAQKLCALSDTSILTGNWISSSGCRTAGCSRTRSPCCWRSRPPNGCCTRGCQKRHHSLAKCQLTSCASTWRQTHWGVNERRRRVRGLKSTRTASCWEKWRETAWQFNVNVIIHTVIAKLRSGVQIKVGVSSFYITANMKMLRSLSIARC